MTRFEQELSGALGEYWKRHAEGELAKVKADLERGQITIDGSGVARNCIGQVLMDDMLEKLLMVTRKANREATRAARSVEVAKELAEYRASYKGSSAAELAEMRAEFGEGASMVNVLTGDEYEL